MNNLKNYNFQTKQIMRYKNWLPPGQSEQNTDIILYWTKIDMYSTVYPKRVDFMTITVRIIIIHTRRWIH